MKKVFVAIILSLAISMAFVACNPDKEKKEIEKMDFSHKKNRARVSAITAFSREKEKSPPDYIRTICKHYVRICVKT